MSLGFPENLIFCFVSRMETSNFFVDILVYDYTGFAKNEAKSKKNITDTLW